MGNKSESLRGKTGRLIEIPKNIVRSPRGRQFLFGSTGLIGILGSNPLLSGFSAIGFGKATWDDQVGEAQKEARKIESRNRNLTGSRALKDL